MRREKPYVRERSGWGGREECVCVVTHSFVNVTSCNPNHAARPIHFFH